MKTLYLTLPLLIMVTGCDVFFDRNIGGVSEGCFGDGTCEDGLVCFEERCCKPDCENNECGTDGCGADCGSCGTNQQCVENLGQLVWGCSCIFVDCTGTCCDDGQVCRETCVDAGELGQPCRIDDTCDGDLACWNGECMEKGTEGAPCTDWGDCDGVLLCDDGVCYDKIVRTFGAGYEDAYKVKLAADNARIAATVMGQNPWTYDINTWNFVSDTPITSSSDTNSDRDDISPNLNYYSTSDSYYLQPDEFWALNLLTGQRSFVILAEEFSATKFSRDSSMVAGAHSYDDEVVIVTLPHGNEIFRIDRDNPYAMDFSPDNTQLVLGNPPTDSIEVWDIGTQQMIEDIWVDLENPRIVEFTSAGDLLAAGDDCSSGIKIYETATWGLHTTLEWENAENTDFDMSFSLDGQYMAVMCGSYIYTLRLSDGAVTSENDLDANIHNIRFSPLNDWLAVGIHVREDSDWTGPVVVFDMSFMRD